MKVRDVFTNPVAAMQLLVLSSVLLPCRKAQRAGMFNVLRLCRSRAS